MTTSQHARLLKLCAMCFVARPIISVSQWCEQNIVFNEPDCHGSFSFVGREYLREPLNAWGDEDVTDVVSVFASQIGKTRIVMGGVCYTMVNQPSRFLWVMPNVDRTGGAKDVSQNRWQPMVFASPAMSSLISTKGSGRHKFKNLQQVIGGSIIDFAGSNSPAALASNPVRIIVLDEVDKFSEGTNKEADAVSLAQQRTKSYSNPKRFKSSTPTIEEGLIWQEFLKTDQRRRFLPCPYCAKFVVFAWSEEYCTLKKTGCEAYIKWDNAKHTDGSPNYEIIKATAHALCPHCQGKIQDHQKTAMDAKGEWRATATAAFGYKGWHLPSMYCSSVQTSFGNLASRFIQDKNSLLGLQAFINGELAEPYMAQDRRAARTEAIGKITIVNEWARLLTVDCQRNAPYYWAVKRAWSNGDSHGISAESCDTVEDIRAIQLRPDSKVIDAAVMVDSGYGAKSDDFIYQMCARFGETEQRQDKLPLFMGWMPSKGMQALKLWYDKETGLRVPYYLSPLDAYSGTAQSGQAEGTLFEFSGEYFKDILEAMRQGKGDSVWDVSIEMATDIYWKHMDGEYKDAKFNPRNGQTTYEWKRRSKHWPNHLFDCEVMQVALAAFFKLFQLPKIDE